MPAGLIPQTQFEIFYRLIHHELWTVGFLIELRLGNLCYRDTQCQF